MICNASSVREIDENLEIRRGLEEPYPHKGSVEGDREF